MTFPFIRPLKHYQSHQQLIEIFMIDIGLMGSVKKKISYLRLELEYIQIGTLLSPSIGGVDTTDPVAIIK